MIRWNEPTEEQRTEFEAWRDARPEHVRAVAKKFDPWTMYRLTTTGQRCRVIGFHETSGDIPVTVYIYAENPVLGEITGVNVFGIDPATVVPWTEGDEPAPLRMDRSGTTVVTAIDRGRGIITLGVVLPDPAPATVAPVRDGPSEDRPEDR